MTDTNEHPQDLDWLEDAKRAKDRFEAEGFLTLEGVHDFVEAVIKTVDVPAALQQRFVFIVSTLALLDTFKMQRKAVEGIPDRDKASSLFAERMLAMEDEATRNLFALRAFATRRAPSESMKHLAELIGEVLAAIATEPDDDDAAEPTEKAEQEAPAKGKRPVWNHRLVSEIRSIHPPELVGPAVNNPTTQAKLQAIIAEAIDEQVARAKTTTPPA